MALLASGFIKLCVKETAEAYASGLYVRSNFILKYLSEVCFFWTKKETLLLFKVCLIFFVIIGSEEKTEEKKRIFMIYRTCSMFSVYHYSLLPTATHTSLITESLFYVYIFCQGNLLHTGVYARVMGIVNQSPV